MGLLVFLLAAGIGVGGYFLGHRNAPTAVAPTSTSSAGGTATGTPLPTTGPTAEPATAAPTAPPTPAPTPAPPTPAPCGPFDHPLDPLDPGTGSATGVDGSGCGNGTVPANGQPFAVPAGWGWSSSHTCSGSAGPDGMGDVLDFTAHNTTTGTDLPTVQNVGTWSHGGSLATGDGSTPPAGNYIIKVTLPHPDVNQCQWHIAVFRGPGH